MSFHPRPVVGLVVVGSVHSTGCTASNCCCRTHAEPLSGQRASISHVRGSAGHACEFIVALVIEQTIDRPSEETGICKVRDVDVYVDV
jgi:hypothetical protein